MLFFGSQGPATMTIIKDGLPGSPALIGFGISGQGPSPLTSTINVEDIDQIISPYYFTVPFTIEINGLMAFFYTFPLTFLTIPTVTIKAQLYEAKETSNIFSAIEETLITLTPSITDATPSGTLLSGEVRTNRTVEKNTKLMLVYFATSNGPDKVDAILGYVKASLAYT